MPDSIEINEAPDVSTPDTATPDPVTSTTDTPDTTKAEVKDIIANAPAQQMHKIVVDGKEMEVSTQDLIRHYGKGKAADSRFQEAAAMKSQAEQFINMLKTDPIKVLSDPRIGHDMRKLAEDYLVSQMKQEMMTPEEKAIQEKLQRLQILENEKAEQDRIKQQEQSKALEMKYADQYQKDIIGTLETAGLPKTEHTVKRMAYYMSQALDQGYELSAKDVVDMVKKDYINEIKALYSGLDGDILMDMLGPDLAKKVSKHNLSKLKNPNGVTKPGAILETPNQSIGEKKKLSMKDWKKQLENMKNND